MHTVPEEAVAQLEHCLEHLITCLGQLRRRAQQRANFRDALSRHEGCLEELEHLREGGFSFKIDRLAPDEKQYCPVYFVPDER